MSREYSNTKKSGRQTTEEKEVGVIDISRMIDDIFKGLFRSWVWILVVVSVFSSAFYFRAKKTYVPQYYAATTFVVNRSSSVVYQESYYNKTTAEQMAKTFPYIIMNDALQHLIEEDLGVDAIPGTISAATQDNTNMITLSVTADTAENAYNILQSVIENYPQIARSVIGETELNVVSETGMPHGPMNAMNAKRAGLKGFFIGAILCAVGLVLYALTRCTIRREDDFKTLLNVKCLASVPMVRMKKRSNAEKWQLLIDNAYMPYGFIESNRTLRTRLEKDSLENGTKVYMVSSAEAREGKSSIAVNAALSLAAKGKKVILVDMDLRHPSVASILGLEEKEKGLIDVLTGEASIEDVMVTYAETSLSVLQGGRAITDDAAKIMGNRQMGELCKELREMADFIIIDTPPSGLLSDAAQIVKYVDAGIFVVRQDYAPLDSIVEGIEMLTDAGLRLVGCILNCAEVGITGYGNGNGYGYGRYGYGRYGYGRYGYGTYGKYGSYESRYESKYERKYEESDSED